MEKGWGEGEMRVKEGRGGDGDKRRGEEEMMVNKGRGGDEGKRGKRRRQRCRGMKGDGG